MKHTARKADQKRRRRSSTTQRIIKWTLVAAVVGLIGFGLSRTSSGVAFDETDIGVVDFSSLTSGQRLSALQAANRARCPCGCGMQVAQCISTDSTCPLRDENIQKVRTMVREARAAS